MRRVRLGTWTCPSGNSVDAYYRALGNDQAVIDMEWDDPPPLPTADHLYYLTTIRPALLVRLREYTERTGAALVLDV